MKLREWIKSQGNPDPLVELAKWDRKYYSYKLQTNRHIQPGDGLFVHLNGGGRTVSVHEEEYEEDGESPTIGEMILAAIREWHKDVSPKRYRLLGSWIEGNPLPIPETSPFWTHLGEVSGMFELKIRVTSEQEALTLAATVVPNYTRWSIWETST